LESSVIDPIPPKEKLTIHPWVVVETCLSKWPSHNIQAPSGYLFQIPTHDVSHGNLLDFCYLGPGKEPEILLALWLVLVKEPVRSLEAVEGPGKDVGMGVAHSLMPPVIPPATSKVVEPIETILIELILVEPIEAILVELTKVILALSSPMSTVRTIRIL